MKKHIPYFNEILLLDNYDWAQVSKEEAIKERQQDIWSDGILKNGISNFLLSINALTDTLVDIRSGTGWIKGERVQISQNDGFCSLNISRMIHGVAVPQSTGNTGIPLVDYTNEVDSYFWIKYLQTKDITQESPGEYEFEVSHPLTSANHFVKDNDGYEIIVDKDHDPIISPLEDALYLGRVKAKGLGVSLDAITSWSYEDRKYCHMTLQDGITDLSIIPPIDNSELEGGMQRKEFRRLFEFAVNLANFVSIADEKSFCGRYSDEEGYEILGTRVVADVFTNPGGHFGTIFDDGISTTASFTRPLLSQQFDRVGKRLGYYKPSTGSQVIHTRRLRKQSTPIKAVGAILLQSNTQGITDSNYDVSLDGGATWKTNQPFNTRIDTTSLNPAFDGKYHLVLKINTPTANASGGVWQTCASTAIPRRYASGFALNGYGYVIGGETTGPSVSSGNEKYDDLTNTWTTKTSLTSARTRAAGLALNGYGYIVGGSATVAVSPESTIQKYDDVADVWVYTESLNTARSDLAGFVLNGYGYAVGGYTGSVSGVTEKYSDISGSWSIKASLSTARKSLTGFSLGGGAYAAGGDTGAATGVVQMYDDRSNSWNTKPSLNTARYGLGSFTLDDFGYTVGGNTVTVERYGNESTTWQTRTNIDTLKSDMVCFSLRNFGYAATGFTTTYSNVVKRYNPHTIKIYGYALRWYE